MNSPHLQRHSSFYCSFTPPFSSRQVR